MDLLRLPPSLRRALLASQCFRSIGSRWLNTQAYEATIEDAPPTPPRSASPTLLTLQPSTLNSYSVGSPPTKSQLRYANTTFTSREPHIIFSTPYFRSLPRSHHPEVAFLGRSNVGKSSLLNALLNRTEKRVAYVSKRPGRTKTMNGFGVGAPFAPDRKGNHGAESKDEKWKRFGMGGCVVVDMPGYGGGSREDWGVEALKFLENRKQLRRTFVLVDAEHGLKQSDIQILLHLRQNGLPHQVVLSKVDKLLYPHAKVPSPLKLSNWLFKLQGLHDQIRQTLADEARGMPGASIGDILCCSAAKSLDERGGRGKLGIDNVRWAILSACGLDCDDRGSYRKSHVHTSNGSNDP